MAAGRIVKQTDANKYDDPIVEDVKDEEDYVLVDSGDDEEDEVRDVIDGNGNKYSTQSNVERKTREAMLKLGMEHVSDVTRATISRAENDLLTMSKLDVYKSPNSDLYVMIGEAKVEDSYSQLPSQAAQQVRLSRMDSVMDTPRIISEASAHEDEDEHEDEHKEEHQGEHKDEHPDKDEEDEDEDEDEDEEEEVDETRFEFGGIELVMAQSWVSRSNAARALKSHYGDIVSALIELDHSLLLNIEVPTIDTRITNLSFVNSTRKLNALNNIFLKFAI